jgi:hypothetical protein
MVDALNLRERDFATDQQILRWQVFVPSSRAARCPLPLAWEESQPDH